MLNQEPVAPFVGLQKNSSRSHLESREEQGPRGLRPDDGASGNYEVPWRVRDVSGLGARHGFLPAVRMDHSENNARPRVRSQSCLGCISSKRIQTGEPLPFRPNPKALFC
jgi:hypothetical protein